MKRLVRIFSVILLVLAVTFSAGFAPPIRISTNGGFLSISINVVIAAQVDNSHPQFQPYKATYVSPTVTKIKDNLFEINFSGAHHKVRIGTGTSQFISRMLFGAWDDECLIDLQMEDITGNLGKATLTGTGENALITVENNAWKLEYYPVSSSSGMNEFGGIDYKMTLKRRTLYNTLNFTFNPTNCVAYHQPPLTLEFQNGWNEEFQCEVAVTETDVTRVSDGQVLVHRPDYVVNSIVFYHASKGGAVTQTDADRGLTTGIVGALYRMKVTDAVGNTSWFDWMLSGTNQITGSISQTFLNSAIYPVIISPVGDTFGFGDITGTSNRAGNGDYILGGSFAATADGTANSISWYNKSGTYDDGPFRFAIYNDDTSDSYMQQTSDSSGTEPVDDWNTLTLNAAQPSIVSGTNYWLCFWGEEYSVLYLSTGGRDMADTTTAYPGSMPANLTAFGGISTDKYCVYCTYTPAASYDISNTPSSESLGILAINTTYYAYGSAPSNPVQDGECTFTVTNNGATAIDLDMKVGDFTGGVGWNIAASPGSNEVKITAYYSGQNPASGLVLTNSDQEFYDGLAASAHIHWDFKLLTGTGFTDGVAKSATLTITARAET
jgi:hypothetical protein